jgi:hypothetical protein
MKRLAGMFSGVSKKMADNQHTKMGKDYGINRNHSEWINRSRNNMNELKKA